MLRGARRLSHALTSTSRHDVLWPSWPDMCFLTCSRARAQLNVNDRLLNSSHFLSTAVLIPDILTSRVSSRWVSSCRARLNSNLLFSWLSEGLVEHLLRSDTIWFNTVCANLSFRLLVNCFGVYRHWECFWSLVFAQIKHLLRVRVCDLGSLLDAPW